MTCKTRRAVRRGKRSKPHYFLRPVKDLRRFDFYTCGVSRHETLSAIQAFEARIDWSTWGRSR